MAFVTTPSIVQNHPFRSASRQLHVQPASPSSLHQKNLRRSVNRRSVCPPTATAKDTSSTVSSQQLTQPSETIERLFRREIAIPPATQRAAFAIFGDSVVVRQETCFNIALTAPLTDDMRASLNWLLAETFDPTGLSSHSELPTQFSVVEVGPRLNFQTAWASNAVTICNACGISTVTRLERSRRYALRSLDNSAISPDAMSQFVAAVHDRMTETVYEVPLSTFRSQVKPATSRSVDVIGGGKPALIAASEQDGLGFDEQDIAYYESLFTSMGRNPTNVELFDLAQSNSEHSRHWFFKGNLVIDGKPVPAHLLDVVRETLTANPRNSVIAFADNSSTIRGHIVSTLQPTVPGAPGPLRIAKCDRDILFTAETHNFPSGVAPFPGAETGTGGRIRDTAATGIGSLVGAGTAGYSVGNLNISREDYPWEDASFKYPDNLASPIDILINASNGASDYGNKFGEPVINGFARTYGVRLDNGERREYVKPIMFSGGMGQMEHSHSTKGVADVGLLVVKVGGPAYRIGMGGGAASSMMQGDNKADLDFNAVQRGDAEMAQKVYRVLRACVELGEFNPIVSIHDQGAGGNCNVVKELIYPSGAKIDVRKVWVGDTSLSALEIWGAEYQEQFGLLLRPEHEELFRTFCRRENVTPAVLGTVDGSGRIVLWDEYENEAVVDMDLEAVLGDLPQKTFVDERVKAQSSPLQLPSDSNVQSVLHRILTLMTVGSKRFLTTKVDRSVTGLIAQQQCVGPLHLPLSDFAVTAQSHFSLRGSATAIGEKPSTTSLDPSAMARMTVGEMLTNLAGAKLTAREDIKCEGNWMWAAKLPGDCASLYDAAIAMRDAMISLGIAIDGGKDSLSMAAKCPTEDGGMETVRAPGTLVVTGYCTMEDVRVKLTPDLKSGGDTVLLLVDIANGQRRMGGGSVAQVFDQVGGTPPDVDSVDTLKNAFDKMQELIGDANVLSYHDVSDGGLLTCLLEMAFGGNCGLDVKVDSSTLGVDSVSCLFAEELGMVVEVKASAADEVRRSFESVNVPCNVVGETRSDHFVSVTDGGKEVLKGDIRDLRDVWEKTSFMLEKRQANVDCVKAEEKGLRERTGAKYVVPWAPKEKEYEAGVERKPKVGILREEGSNGDREMSAAFHMAGFEVWDICMRDISSGRVSLRSVCGIAFVGGFSFGDVLDSAKGWAGVVRLNPKVREEFDAFYARSDTFSFGVCNGCQLMALLGRVPFDGSDGDVDFERQPRFIRNVSGRYESRFSTVRIEEGSPAMMLKGMGGAQLGVWVAHGEGRAFFPDKEVFDMVKNNKLAAVKYVNGDGDATMAYPDNPNGSVGGIAGLCSKDGRHLAMMPHPERTVLKWQWPYSPEEISSLECSPWLTMFQNARDWVREMS